MGALEPKTKAAIIITIIIIGAVAYVAGYFTPKPGPAPAKSLYDIIKERGYIVVGTSADYPPFEYINETTGEIVGFDADVMNYIADKLGVSIKWKDIAFDSLIPTLKAGDIDVIIAAMELTPERAAELGYSTPYYTTKRVVVVLKSFAQAQGITAFESFEDFMSFFKDHGFKIGVQSGTTHEDRVMGAASKFGFPSANIVSYPKADTMFMDLSANKIQAVVVDEATAVEWSEQYDLVTVYKEPGYPLVIFMRKGEIELQDAINAAILEMLAKGVVADLAAKWGIPPP